MAYFHGVIFAVREAETLTVYLHFQTRTQSLLMSLGERERRLDSIEARRVTWEVMSPRAPPISSPFPPRLFNIDWVKPGSYMSSTYLRHSRRYCLGHCSDIRKEVASNRDHLSLYCRHACEVDSSSTSQACRPQRLG